MRCHRCQSIMVRIRSESNPGSRQEWFQCSLCGRASLLSTPGTVPPSSGWVAQATVGPGERYRG